MTFGEKLKKLREEKKLSQTALADMLGISMRTIQNYESGKGLPRKTATVSAICNIFNIPSDYLINEQESFILQANEKYPRDGKKEAEILISQLGGLFAGGELKEEDKDKVFKAITDLYFDAKEKNKKYKRKK